jgi:outer membrane protein OmpA-like peptidoglycan-associated protein
MNIPTMPRARTLRQAGRVLFLSVFLGAPGAGLAASQPASPADLTATPAVLKAIDYRSLTHSTVIGFRGTVLMPEAKGTARIIPRPGGILRIKARFGQLRPAGALGPENLTYVLWAVTPVGLPTNLGEVATRRSGRAELEVDTSLQAFGLLVSAEPYFAVTRVSRLVVLENLVTQDTRGPVEEVEARCEVLPRGAYLPEGGAQELPAPDQDRKVSPYVRQAGNAMRIARAEGAEEAAPEEFRKASELMVQLEAVKKKWKKPAVILARQVVQAAEDARLVAQKRQGEARVARAQQEAATAQAQVEAEKLAASREAEQAKARAEADARQARDQANREASAEKLLLRRKLRDQLDRLLATRETEAGLVVSLSDLLFPTGKAVLLGPTREKLAKAAGILLAYPGLQVHVEGHADATGRPAFNERLSRQRAHAVRDYLVRQGLPPDRVTATGHGSSRPIASNDTRSGRQQNRRVELILTGGVIGF